MDDGYEIGVVIGLIFFASGIGSYYSDASLGCIVFGGGLAILALFGGILNWLDKGR